MMLFKLAFAVTGVDSGCVFTLTTSSILLSVVQLVFCCWLFIWCLQKGLLMVEELSVFSLVTSMWPFCLVLFSQPLHGRNIFGSLTISLSVLVPPATPSPPALWERDSSTSALLSSLISWLLNQLCIYLIEHGDLFLNSDFPSSCFPPSKTPFFFSNAGKNSQ